MKSKVERKFRMVFMIKRGLSAGMSVCLLVLLVLAGCSSGYTENTVTVPASGSVQVSVDVRSGEYVDGNWQSSYPIAGSYTGPVGSKLSWSVSSSQHDFLLDGASKPGAYLFTFRDAGSNGGTLIFKYRSSEKPPNARR